MKLLIFRLVRTTYVCVSRIYKMIGMYEMVDNVCNTIFVNVPDYFKAQKVCEKAVAKYLNTIRYVPTRFITQQM